MKVHLDLVTTAEAVREIAQELSGHDLVAFDTEFIREKTFFPELEILQIGTEKDVWLIDVKAFKKRMGWEDLEPLLAIFRDPKILKIVHAAQADQECLFTAFGVVASPSFDTAVGASLCGYGDTLGLSNLLSSALGVKIRKGHARTNWSQRPLPQELLEYAASDVEHLVPLARKLLKELDRLQRREWALELTAYWENIALYESDPEGLFRHLAGSGKVDRRGLGVLRRLVEWRENTIRRMNIPRKWLMDDGLLLDLARVRPREMKGLQTFRGIGPNILRTHGETLLRLIQEGSEERSEIDPREFRTGRQEPLSSEESQVADVVKCYVSILAQRHQIASRHLLSSAQVAQLLRSKGSTPEDWVQEGIMTRGASCLIGEELQQLLRGETGLTLRDGKVEILRF